MRTGTTRTLTFFLAAATISFIGCKANPPSRAEKKIAQESKDLVIGGKDWHNPVANDASNLKLGAENFQRHCQACHGLDGHATGVAFSRKMSPPVPDLGSPEIQKYTDGQLKWVIENGIRMTGMPGWRGLLNENDMWQMVLYIRHLPSRGSPSRAGNGVPPVFAQQREHRNAESRE